MTVSWASTKISIKYVQMTISGKTVSHGLYFTAQTILIIDKLRQPPIFQKMLRVCQNCCNVLRLRWNGNLTGDINFQFSELLCIAVNKGDEK